MIWTDELKDQVQQLWTDGWSAQQIAVKLGAVSRNAIIGIVFRNGWKRSETRRVAWPPQRIEQLRHYAISGLTVERMAIKLDLPATAVGRKLKSLRRPELKLKSVHRKVSHAPRRAKISERIVPTVTAKGSITFGDLTNNTCRWPSGSPGQADFSFCGAASNLLAQQPYCDFHAYVSRFGFTEAELR